MGKKSKRSKQSEELYSDAVPFLEFRYENPLFAVACHPHKPILVAGMATGHVYCHEYDTAGLRNAREMRSAAAASGTDEEKHVGKDIWNLVDVPAKAEEEDDDAKDSCVKTLWKTRRHKGSVRSLCFEPDGTYIYSIGSDCVLKKAETLTGKVVKKKTLSSDPACRYTKMVKSLTHPALILGTESGDIELYDSTTLKKLNTIRKVHNGDAINDIFQFSGRSAHRYISLGQTTLAHWNSKESNENDFVLTDDDPTTKRKVMLSDDQEDEALCGCFVDPEDGETLVCGMGEGVLTVWKPKKNDLMDQLTRIKIKKSESIDCVIPTLEDDNCVWCGCSDGNIYKVQVKSGKCVEVRKHSELDEVSFLDLDFDYKLLSGGMDSVKLWDSRSTKGEEANGDGSSSEFSEQSDSDSDDDSNASSSEQAAELVGLSKEELIAELDKDLERSSKEEESDAVEPTTKKQKRGKKSSNLQQKNKEMHHGIRKFEGL